MPRQSYPPGVLDGGAGLVREYHPGGRLMALGQVDNFLQQGLWKYYNQSGLRSAVGIFRDGMPHGRWLYYSEDREYRVVHWETAKREGFRICLPQGWQGVSQEGHVLHCIQGQGDPDSPWISVSQHGIRADMGIREFTLQLLTRSEKSLRAMHFQIQEMEPQWIRNLEACVALTTVDQGKRRLFTRMAFIQDDEDLYKVQAVCPEGTWPLYRVLFEECLRSFLLVKPQTPLKGLHLLYPPELDEERGTYEDKAAG